MRPGWKRTIAICAAMVSVTAAAACSSSSTSSPASSGPVQIQFWGWAPGYQKSVDLFNASHKDIHVTFNQIASGSKGGYTRILNAVTAGNAPCVASVGFETMPTFAEAGALQDITQYASADQSQFSTSSWSGVTIAGHVYGIPVDEAPMALFYRKDLFAKYGITTPPATWAQYATDAATIHAADPNVYIGDFGNDAYNFIGLVQQAGAKWFGTSDDQWTVGINDAATQKVAAYWQNLISEKYVATNPSFDTALYKGLDNGTILSDVNAVWDAPILAQSAPDPSGKWAVAPVPVWNAADPTQGNDGGTPNVVLKGCQYPQQATEFADWFSTNTASVTNLINVTGIYPSATSGLSNPALSAPDPYFGGQDIFNVFKAASAQITPWTWGPVMTTTSGDLGDLLGQAETGGNLPSGLSTLQTGTVQQMQNQGLSVTTQ